MSTGTVGILNVGAGDVSVSFDKVNPSERIRTARIVRDMIRRGYALLVEVERNGEKRFERAIDFDEEQCRYIIADFDPLVAEEADAWGTVNHEANKTEIRLKEHVDGESVAVETTPDQESTPATPGKRGRTAGKPNRKYRTGVDADKTKAVAVGRSAGG